MENVCDRLKSIKIENLIWIIYIGIIILSYYSNYLEKDYLIFNNEFSKDKYRKIIIFIFTILVIVYFYFLSDSYKSIEKIDFSNISKNNQLEILSFIGSLLVFISGIIFLHIAINDKDLNVELAFN